MADSDEHETDAALLKAWRDGDLRAGERLFRRHASAVVRFFENKVHHGVEDLIQATFMGMLENRDRIRGDHRFRNYLFGIARNVLHGHLRTLARGREVDVGVESMADLAPGPTTVVGGRAEHRILLEALRHLPIEDQILIELSYWEGLRSAALGEVLGVAPSTVRSRLPRARQRLEEAITHLQASPELLDSTVEGLDGWAAEIQALLTQRKANEAGGVC